MTSDRSRRACSAPARSLPLALALLLTAGVLPTPAQVPDSTSGVGGGPPPAGGAELTLGEVDFPVTASNDEARREFALGVLALHSFWYQEAVEHFRRARQLEPGLAMAYWGEAMAHDRPFWGLPPDTAAARAVLSELDAAEADGTIPAKLTDRERAWLKTARALYAREGSLGDRRRSVAEGLEGIAERWPGDDEARVFSVLYRMSLEDWDPRDEADVERVAAVLEDVFERRPRHPGAAHYLIHAYDSPEFAERGLEAARAFAAIAPSSSHALHMPSHIFFELGMWTEAVRSNEEAWKATVAWAEREGRPAVDLDFHPLGWWIFALTQQGRFEEAAEKIRVLERHIAAIWSDGPPRTPTGLRLPVLAALTRSSYVVEARAAGLGGDEVETGVAPEVARQLTEINPGMTVMLPLTEARTAAGARLEAILNEARAAAEGGSGGAPVGNPRELVAFLEGRVALEAGDTTAALDALDRAAELREESGQILPHVLFPMPREVRGKVLLAAGRPRAALADFRSVLEEAPRRPRSLLGAARAADAAGDAEAAAARYRELLDVWTEANQGLPAAEEARTYLDGEG